MRYIDKNFLKENYEFFLFDIFGVIHDGVNAYPGSIDFVNTLTTNKKVIFLSNVPRPSSLSYEHLKNLGIEREFTVITSGDLAQNLLKTKFWNKKVFHWGEKQNPEITKNINLISANTIEDADLILLTYHAEEGSDLSEQEETIVKICELQKPVMCANPDEEAIFNGKKRLCSGYFARKILNKGGTVTQLGKPFPKIYQFLELKNKEIKAKKYKALMIGDTLETDIAGAFQYGLDTLLILSGITGEKLKKNNLSLDEYINKNKLEYRPNYIMQSF